MFWFWRMIFLNNKNELTVEMPKDIPNDKMNIPLYIYNDSGVAYSKFNDLIPHTLQFDRCNRIVFRDRTLDFQFEIPCEEYKNIDTIIVNGITFKRVEDDEMLKIITDCFDLKE